MNVKERLTAVIEEGRHSEGATIDSITREYNSRRDMMVTTPAINFEVVDGKVAMRIKDGEVEKELLNLTPHSESQMYSRVGVPMAYGQALLGMGMNDLLVRNLRDVAAERLAKEKTLLRVVGSVAKGFLSPAFKRIDASPIFASFIQSAKAMGMVPIRGFNTDYRYQLRYAFQDVIMPSGNDNEATLMGASLTTGDYGSQSMKIELFLMRLICLNGMVGIDVMRKVHIGSRIESEGDVFELSQTTHDLDTKTIASTVNDIMKALPAKRETVEDVIVESGKREPGEPVWARIRKNVNKETFKQIEDTYKAKAEVTLLPEVNSTWRLANAISLIAQSQERDDRRIDMENLAMNVLGIGKEGNA